MNEIVSGVNITVAADGSLTGHGVFLDLTPVAVTGHVKDSGEIILLENAGGHQTRLEANFASNGKSFFLGLPNGFFVTGKKIPARFPEAGVYHATTTLGDRAIFFVVRNGTVNGIIYHAGKRVTEVRGPATTVGFKATSETGLSFSGKFDGTVISGAVSDG